MTEPINNVYREGDFTIAVQYDMGFDALAVYVLERRGPGYKVLFNPDGELQINSGDRIDGYEPTLRISREYRVALGRALLGAEPASQQLIDTLQSQLKQESGRVDKLLDAVANARTS